MMLLYGLLRSMASAARRLAERAHRRSQAAYAKLEEAFHEVEQSCKADEVREGRPVDYSRQFTLLKTYESRERARQRWMKRTKSLDRYKGWEARIRSFGGRKLPYTFGMVDMALIMKSADLLGHQPEMLSLVHLLHVLVP